MEITIVFLILIIIFAVIASIHHEKESQEIKRQRIEREERVRQETERQERERQERERQERERQERERQERKRQEAEYKQLESDALKKIEFSDWNVVSIYDEQVIVKSRTALDKYDSIKFFKDNKEKLEEAENIIKRNTEITKTLKLFIQNNEYKTHPQYNRLMKQINNVLANVNGYKIEVCYISSAGNNLCSNLITVNQYDIDKFKQDPFLFMNKGEFSIYLKKF